jgi:hypothetical protein
MVSDHHHLQSFRQLPTKGRERPPCLSERIQLLQAIRLWKQYLIISTCKYRVFHFSKKGWSTNFEVQLSRIKPLSSRISFWISLYHVLLFFLRRSINPVMVWHIVAYAAGAGLLYAGRQAWLKMAEPHCHTCGSLMKFKPNSHSHQFSLICPRQYDGKHGYA